MSSLFCFQRALDQLLDRVDRLLIRRRRFICLRRLLAFRRCILLIIPDPEAVRRAFVRIDRLDGIQYLYCLNWNLLRDTDWRLLRFPVREANMDDEYERQDGLSCVTKNATDTRINVVFIHGLGGGAFSTWNSGNETELGFWPAQLANDFSSCCVWTLHYTARILDWNPFARSKTIDILDKSAWLVDELVLNKIHEKPIVFVVHSMGGVLVKQALQFSQSFGPPEWRSVWDQTKTIIFLATPHVGAKLVNIVMAVANGIRGKSMFARIFIKPTRALKNLEERNPSLRYLRDWYRDHAPAQGIETIAYAEGRDLAGVTVVDVDNANPQIANCPTLQLSDEDHISIAKPAARDSKVYLRVSECLTDLEQRLTDRRIEDVPVQLDQKAMTRIAEARQLISKISGCWWERIKRGEANAISFFDIRPHSPSNSVSLGGYSYKKDGSISARWDSVITGITKDGNTIVIRYLWIGRHDDQEIAHIAFHGFGRMVFRESGKSDGRIDRGDGGFWDVNESQPDKTMYKPIALGREVDEETIHVMNNGTTEEIESCARRALDKW